MEFGSIIKRSWQITWKYKALWVLGVFAGVSGCQGGGGGSGGSGTNFGQGVNGNQPDFRGFVDALQQWLPALIAGLMLLVLVGLVMSVFSVAARGALIVGVNRIEEGLTPALGTLWAAGFSRFWTLVGLDILLRLPVVAVMLFVLVGVFAPLAGTLFSGGAPGAEVFVPVCGSLAIGVPLLMALSFVLGIMDLVARRYVMLSGQGAIQAAGNSWRFFRARFKDTFLMWLINAGLNMAAAFVVAIPFVIIAIAVAIPAGVAAASKNWGMLFPVAGVAFVLIMLVSFAYAAIWGTFTSALWTVFFRRVTGMEQPQVLAQTIAPAFAEPYGSAAPSAQPQPPVAPPAEPYSPAPPMAIPAPPAPPAPPAGDYPANPPTPPAPGV